MQSAEIRSYTKGRYELKVEPKALNNEICKVYGDNEVSYRQLRNRIEEFNSGIDSIEDTSRSCRPSTAVTQTNISKVSGILNSDVRYTSYEITGMTGSLEVSTCTILKKNLKLACKIDRWIPHILTNKQKAARMKWLKLLKLYPKFEWKILINIVTGDETWVYNFEPQRRIDNNI